MKNYFIYGRELPPFLITLFAIEVFIIFFQWLQEEFDDDDEWNPCKAAGVCLMLMATCCEDDVVQHVLPFVRDNIHNEDWRYRDAAVMAFGNSQNDNLITSFYLACC